MIVNHVKNDGDAPVMGGLNQPPQSLPAPVDAADGKGMGRVITPGKLTGKGFDRHQLNGVYA